MANIVKKDGGQGQHVQRAGDLIRMDPFSIMRDLIGFNPLQMFGVPPRFARELAWSPSFEVRETDDAFVFKADVPGTRVEDLEITVAGNRLTISGRREEEPEISRGTLHTGERLFGEFTRTFTLPESADVDKIRTDLAQGVLTLMIPKKQGSSQQPRRIPIESPSRS